LDGSSRCQSHPSFLDGGNCTTHQGFGYRTSNRSKSVSTGIPKIVAGRAPAGPFWRRRYALSKFWGRAPTPAPPKRRPQKKVQHKCNSNSNIYIFMKYKYYIVNTLRAGWGVSRECAVGTCGVGSENLARRRRGSAGG
jgi:hypothetical protein